MRDRGRNRLLGNERAPSDVAGVERREVGQELLADARAQAVGPDQDRCGRGRTAREMRGDAVRALLDVIERHAAMIAIGRKRVAEHPIKPVP